MKNIIITGSSSGFGLKAAKDFADKGYKVFATMRNPSGKNANKKAELEGHSAHITVVDMDVTDDASVQQAIGGIIAAEGKVDVLINNAGIMFLGITEAFSVDQAHEQMNANYYSAIRTMQAVLPAMRKAGSGLIINTSSLVGRISPPFSEPTPPPNTHWKATRKPCAMRWRPLVWTSPSSSPAHSAPAFWHRAGHPPLVMCRPPMANWPECQPPWAAEFPQMLSSDDAADPQLVVNAYLTLAEMPAGKRPMRTQVGISPGVDEINRLTQPIQDNMLKEMQLDRVLGGVSA